MATFRTFLLFATIFLTSLAHAKRRSSKYFKARAFPFGYPIGVCYPRQVDSTHITSIKLVCEEDPTDCPSDGTECERMVVAQRFNTEDCSGPIKATDKFKNNGRRLYPFNCYEREELEDESVTADPDDYATSYMILRMTRGEEVPVRTLSNDTTTTTTECSADAEADFYRTFPAITDRCMMGWSKQDGVDTPEWHLTRCNENAVEIRSFALKRDCTDTLDALDAPAGVNGTNVTLPEPMRTLYSENGCDNQPVYNEEDALWYTEVLQCTHPDYTISGAMREGAYAAVMALVVTLTLYVI